MKYEINRENLQYAYKKLKQYFYYYNSSKYLKKELLEFEQNWHDNDTFDSYFEKLCDEKEFLYLTENISTVNKVNTCVYPKKNSIVENGLNKIEIKDSNTFIKMPIPYYLIDILFVVNIYDKLKDTEILNNKLSFGNIFDKDFISTKGDIKNPFLMADYRDTYLKWKNKPFIKFKKENNEKCLLIGMDIKKCFYNFKFNLDNFIEEVFPKEKSLIFELEKTIYEKYTFNACKDIKKHQNEVILPVGLISSSVILNYYLYELDKKINERVLSYSRYADDILLLVNYEEKYEKKSCVEILNNFFEIEKGDNSLNIVLNSEKIHLKLPLNTEKTSLKVLDKKENICLSVNISSIMDPSFYDDYDHPLVTQVDAQKNTNLNILRSYLMDDSIFIQEKDNLISSLSNVDLLNCFSIWDLILKNVQNKNYIKQKILFSISLISEIYKEDIEKFNIGETLKEELEICEELSKNGNEYENFLLTNISQNSVFNQIKNFKKFRYKVYPKRITKTELMLFYQIIEKKEINENLISFIERKYNYFNCLSCKSNDSIEISNIDGLIKIFNSNTKSSDLESNIKIAVVNLNLPDVYDKIQGEKDMVNYDLKANTNVFYLSLYFELIDNAANLGAKYILFPEFGIPYNYISIIIGHCFKRRISLICGCTHIIS